MPEKVTPEKVIPEKTMICSTCGCSLVRLGVSKKQAVHYEYQSIDYVFCCQSCMKLFQTSPEMYLKETTHTIVCPTCLSEKPSAYSVPFKYKEASLYFCRCPYCLDTFNENPEYYLDRLAGETDFKGLFADDETACCH